MPESGSIITSKPTTPFNDKFVTYEENINEELISDAIKEFIGEHDFRYFHKMGSDKDITVREVFNASFYKYKGVYVFRFEANSYLRSQIRLMVGFLLAINDNKQTIENLKKQLRRSDNLLYYWYSIIANEYNYVYRIY